MHYREKSRELLRMLVGIYTTHRSLLFQIKWSRILSYLLFLLIFSSLISIGILNSHLLSNLRAIGWNELYNNHVTLLNERNMNQDQLFTFALYVLSIKSLFNCLILYSLVLLWQMRCGYSAYSKTKDMNLLLNLSLNPFPWKTYDHLSKNPLEDRRAPVLWKGTKLPFPQMDSQGPLITTDALTFSYDSKADGKTLKDVSLSISMGKFTTILGCNGSSKSAFLKVILRLLEKYEGRVTWITTDAKLINRKSFYGNIAYVAQDTLIQGEMSLYDYVACGLFPSHGLLKLGQPDNDEIVLESLEKMGIAHHRNKNVRNLSGGERQRATLALALAQRTPIIVLDEPTSYLDVKSQYRILEILKELQIKENKTIVTVLHDLGQAKQFSDEVILLRAGSLYAHGPAQEVMVSRELEGFFGD